MKPRSKILTAIAVFFGILFILFSIICSVYSKTIEIENSHYKVIAKYIPALFATDEDKYNISVKETGNWRPWGGRCFLSGTYDWRDKLVEMRFLSEDMIEMILWRDTLNVAVDIFYANLQYPPNNIPEYSSGTSSFRNLLPDCLNSPPLISKNGLTIWICKSDKMPEAKALIIRLGREKFLSAILGFINANSIDATFVDESILKIRVQWIGGGEDTLYADLSPLPNSSIKVSTSLEDLNRHQK